MLAGLAVATLLVHVVVLATPSLATIRSPWSNLAQLALGALAVLAMLEASWHSGRFGRQTWFLAALAVGAYTIGQGIITYRWVALYHSSSPHAKDQFFFFWVIPLLAAGAADASEKDRKPDWTDVLDFAQIVVVALAVDFFLFGDAARWQADSQQMNFLKWKVRLIRDVVVLGCLWSRALVSDSRQIRALFSRLGIFYFAYSCADAIYLYLQASANDWPNPWLDLLWSLPRFLAVVLAVTWNWPEDIPRRPLTTGWRRRCTVVYWAPIAAPLMVWGLAFSSPGFRAGIGRWTWLIAATFVIASLRLLITQFRQERTLESLHSSNDLLGSIVEGTSEAIYLKDVEGRYRLINAAGARFLGRNPSDVVGKTDRDLMSIESMNGIAANDQEVLRTGQGITVEETLSTAGVTRTFLSTKNALRDTDGKIAGVLGISLDVTERRRMEEHLRHAQRMESIGTFSGGIAHDFNNLLTVIRGYSQLAISQPEEHRQNQDYFGQINAAAGRACTLVSQLLAFSRKQILQPRVLNLNEIVTDMQGMLGRLIGEDVEIHARLAYDLGLVKADLGQVEQVLMNLAANARDAMPAGGKLILETSNVTLADGHSNAHFKIPPGSYVLITVSDTGVGMDAQTLPRIFEPFFTTKPQGKGTGLGLATVYGIVRQSGGYIWVHSAPGMGTIFRIYLPRVAGHVEPLAPRPKLVTPKGGNQTILVVDDDLQLRRFAERVLTKAGFTVLEAETGEEAQKVASCHRGPIHLLLTDVVLPGSSGREIAQRICGNRGETQLLYMSGYAGDTIVQRGVLEAGICFLQKPFSPELLLEKVKEMLHAPPVGGESLLKEY
jgi:PAS domain S-box-containing protein